MGRASPPTGEKTLSQVPGGDDSVFRFKWMTDRRSCPPELRSDDLDQAFDGLEWIMRTFRLECESDFEA